MNAREVIASSACAHGSAEAWGALSTHNHTECLAEADKVLAALVREGYQVVAATTLATVAAAANPSAFVRKCGHPQCACRFQ